ncbi:hypothetical protein B0T10DRAFT_18918 [Thelonectria olida]|uniref:Uncharacterized protein n=1 Tax=Thelonectria olida TaxID=1576542 RepID=A0A9P8WHU5_9HYPO|nr:hypothetical protein B0T10DRAFT_18918 [Thelonectria olida]
MGDQFLDILTTTPPWLRHCFFVYIVDFNSTNTTYRRNALDPSAAGVETALFVQANDDPVAGTIFAAHREPCSGNFVHYVRPFEVPQDGRFDPEATIGFIFKKDAENLLPIIAKSLALPRATNPASKTWPDTCNGQKDSPDWRPPLKNSTD